MNIEDKKCVIVLEESLPAGILANTAAILGITLGRMLPDIVGPNVSDREGHTHAGIIQLPLPILRGNSASLRQLRDKLLTPEYADLTSADFTDLAQGCKTYSEFMEKMSACSGDHLAYIGIAICGDRRKVNRLTGSMPLLR